MFGFGLGAAGHLVLQRTQCLYPEFVQTLHFCGAVYPFVDHFIDSGFDILNPVQCSATDMDPQRPSEYPRRQYCRDVQGGKGSIRNVISVCFSDSAQAVYTALNTQGECSL